jgi:DHA1 family bicyclomycin/chloramphenicol resistance-like MFS transporter
MSSPRTAPLWLLTLITFSGTLAMHIFVPALPEAAQELGATVGEMQLTMSVYIAGLAVGQLAYGPLSDRFGRRPMLIVGLVVYAVTGIAASFAPDVHALIAARLFQALGGCAGLVIGRAIVRDTGTATEAGRRLALMNLMVAIGPGTAPLVGGLLTTFFGWRSIFYLLATLGVVNMAFTWFLLPETRADTPTPGIASLGRNYASLLTSRPFLGYAIGGGCATTSMYAFVSASPFIIAGQLHRPTYEVGIYLAVLISGIWIGSALTARLITRLPLDRLTVGANLFSVVAAAVFLIAVLTEHLSVPLVVAPMFFYAVGVGMASPAALTQAISVNPKVIGSASGLYGFAQMGVGAVCTALAGIGSNPALAVALVLAGAGTIAQTGFWIAVRYRDPAFPTDASR